MNAEVKNVSNHRVEKIHETIRTNMHPGVVLELREGLRTGRIKTCTRKVYSSGAGKSTDQLVPVHAVEVMWEAGGLVVLSLDLSTRRGSVVRF
jgi:hypothetical protein